MSLTPRLDRLEINKIINGNFDFWQRGTSFAAVTNGSYTADRFFYTKDVAGSAVHTVARSTDVPNIESTYSILADCTTTDVSLAANELYSLSYIMEGRDLLPLAGKTFTLSFWVKATLPGTYCVSFRNTASDRSYIAEYVVEDADTWEKKSVTVLHNTSGTWNYNNAGGLRIDWVLANGTTRQNSANTWHIGNYVATANQVNAVNSTANDFRISQVMLVQGDAAPEEFVMAGRNIAEEFELCQRYYELWTGRLRAALQSGTNEWPIPMKVSKRQVPTVAVIGVIANAVNSSVDGFSVSTDTAATGNISITIDAEL